MISTPDEITAEWDHCFLLQARDVANVEDYNFTYLGNRILNAYVDGTNELDPHNHYLIGPNAFRLSGRFAKALETRAPVFDEGEFRTLANRRVLYRQILLPLGTEKSGVVAIFGSMNYKIAED